MPEISYTGPVLVEEGGVTRTLTADDIRGEQGPQGATGATGLTGSQGEPGEALVMADGGTAVSITVDLGLDGGGV